MMARFSSVSVSSLVRCIGSAYENDPDSLGGLRRQDHPTEIFCVILMAGVTVFRLQRNAKRLLLMLMRVGKHVRERFNHTPLMTCSAFRAKSQKLSFIEILKAALNVDSL